MATSVAAGDMLDFRISGAAHHVVIQDTVRDRVVHSGPIDRDGDGWRFAVPTGLPSSLYRADFGAGEFDAGDHAGAAVYFAVRPQTGQPDRILVSVPFLTWLAYHRLGVPGEGLYLTEQPDRAVRVSFDQPGVGPDGDWSMTFYRWLLAHGYPVDFCSNLDLHSGAVPLTRYRLLISQGHDEYWTWQMRDAVESFTDAGGNVAFFGGNTCWWQVRLEDDLRTMVCYRDAVRDPFSHSDPARTTVEWSSSPVNRPENAMTGVSFRYGAGCWEDHSVMASTAYTTRFADHWVFAGTGLADGDQFGQAAVGYETDAADFIEIDGVPLVTGRDGTSPSFVVLASADLRHWRRYGQGGQATMGIFRRGAGTVFTAATVNWGNRIGDPLVEQVTRNVLDRLANPSDPSRWDDLGSAPALRCLAACDMRLYAVNADGQLLMRENRPQNLAWQVDGHYPGLRLVTAPRESDAGLSVGLYGLFDSDLLAYRDPDDRAGPWTPLGPVPAGVTSMAFAHKGVYVTTDDGILWQTPLTAIGSATGWTAVDRAPAALVAMTNLNGRLYGLTSSGRLVYRLPVPVEQPWLDLGPAEGLQTLTALGGRLIAGGRDGRLRDRAVVAPRPRLAAVDIAAVSTGNLDLKEGRW